MNLKFPSGDGLQHQQDECAKGRTVYLNFMNATSSELKAAAAAAAAASKRGGCLLTLSVWGCAWLGA